MVDDSFIRGYVRCGVDGSLEVVHQLLVVVGVLAVREAELQRMKIMP